MEGEPLTSEEEANNYRTNNWAFTINNPTDNDRQLIEILSEQITYMIIGNEIGKCGTPHIQGTLNAKNKISFKQLKKCLPRAHIKKCIKSLATNISYCMKDADYKEFGHRPQQGKRNDLVAIKNDIINGKKVNDIVMENPMIYHQYGRTLEKIEDINNRKKFRNFMTKGIWCYGSTGTCKSESAYKDYHPDNSYTWNLEEKFQNGYCGQDTVIIDDFDGEISYGYLKRMVDKHPNCVVPIKCRDPFPFISKTVIITCSRHPSEIYNKLQENDSIDQLLRRFEIRYYSSPNYYVVETFEQYQNRIYGI